MDSSCKGRLFQKFKSAYGIRFRGKNNINEALHFNNLNIFAKARKPSND